MNISARRDIFRGRFGTPPLQASPHAGLWLDKFLPKQTEQGGDSVYKPHFEDATKIRVSPLYHRFFERWEQTLKDAGAVTARAETLGRLVVGLGADSVLENAITLHRTYGVPVIPGSALKGLAAAYAHNRLEDDAWHVKTDNQGNIVHMGKAYKTLFGDTTSAGYVTFFDALYVPGSAAGDKPLALDVVTVHHPDYYQSDSPPADWDSPNPVPFVSVRDGVKFLVALAGPEEWVEATFQILGRALEEDGIGAKTNSGYGRMELESPSARGREASSRATPEMERFRLRLEGMATKDVAGQIYSVYQEWKALEADADTKRQIAQMILDKVEAAGRTKKSRKKIWYQELVAFVESGEGRA